MSGLGRRLAEKPHAVEASLWRRLRYEQKIECRALLVDRFIAFAKAIARGEQRRRPSLGLERADFEHFAVTGLLEAIDRFDPLNGSPFEAFARPRIRGAIADGAARASESGAQFAFRQRLERERLASIANSEHEIKEPVERLHELAAGLAMGLLAQEALSHAAESAQALDVYETVAWRETALAVGEAIAALPKVERTIVEQHYRNSVPFQEIAKMLGLSKGRISQLHRAALGRMRETLRQKGELP